MRKSPVLVFLHSFLVVGSLLVLTIPTLAKTEAEISQSVDSTCDPNVRFQDPFKCGTPPNPCASGRLINPFRPSTPAPSPLPNPTPGNSK
jgi:hypothetical protein